RQVQPELAVPEALSTLAAPDRWSADAQVQQDLGGDLVAGLSTAVTHERLPFVASPLITDTMPVPESRATPSRYDSLGPSPSAAGLPDTPNVERTLVRLQIDLAKALSNRTEGTVRYAGTLGARDPLALDPRAPWVPGFLDPLRRHQLDLLGAWSLPTDPLALRLHGQLGWRSGIDAGLAAGTAVDDAPWLRPVWLAAVNASQRVPISRQQLWIDLGVSVVRNAQGVGFVPLEATVMLPAAQALAEPPFRIRGGVRYEF
nr:hypothetical protein [Myxococcales bacterium]